MHRVAHGIQAPPAVAPAATPAQPPQQVYQQPDQGYGQPPSQAYQPPAPAQYQPPAGLPPAQYQPPAGPPPVQYQPPAGPPSFQPPAAAGYAAPTQYQQPTAYQPPNAHQLPATTPSPVQHASPQYGYPAQEYAPPPGAPPGAVPQASYQPPATGPPSTYQSPATTGRPVPQLPPRANSVTSVTSVEPAAPVKAPLPDPSSFPKPPPFYGRDSSQPAAQPPARATPPLPQRNTPPPPSRNTSTPTTAPPSYSSIPPPTLPSRAVPAVPAVPAQPASAAHKKPPPPPVKPKTFLHQNSSQPEAPVQSPQHTQSPSPAQPMQPTGYNAVASQLGNALTPGATGSFRDRLKSFNGPASNAAPASNPPSIEQNAVNGAEINNITSHVGKMALNPANQSYLKNAYNSINQQPGAPAAAATPPAHDPNQSQVNSAGFSAIAGSLTSMASNPANQTSIKNKVAALNQSQPNFASQIASRFNPTAQPQPAVNEATPQAAPQAVPQAASPAHKKAPPPPPKKPGLASRNSAASSAPSPSPSPHQFSNDAPPPINFATRPQAFSTQPPPPTASPPVSAPAPAPAPAAPAPVSSPLPGQKEFDLQLQTLWFTAPANNLHLPPTLSGLNYVISTTTSGAAHTLTIALRIAEDLSIVKYRLSWQSHDPLNTVSVERKELPAPPVLPQTQLIQAHEQFGNGVAAWAEAMLGRQVGDGECWTLAKEAIDHSSHGYAMSPQGYTHGALVYHATGGASAPIAYNDSIRRGDVLQFTSGRFETRNAQGQVTSTAIVGQPNHTSIVTSVSANNRVVEIVQQNVSGVKQVQKGSHNLDELTQGDVKIFRPVWKEWAGELNCTW